MEMTIHGIGVIRSSRLELRDDNWLSEHASIELEEAMPLECLEGLADFSHIEVLYFFHKVEDAAIILGSEHPRENPDWPRVGIFAQRKRARPNKIGSTICKIIDISGRQIRVEGLDAIDGTPVLDIKPIMVEYLPREAVKEPEWAKELMKEYW